MINSNNFRCRLEIARLKHDSRFECEVLENLPFATRNDVANARLRKTYSLVTPY